MRTSGTAIEDGFGSAATAVDGIPIVGGDLAGALAAAGGGTGGQVAALGREGRTGCTTPRVLGLITFALPAALLLLLAMPGRVRQVRKLTAAAAALDGEPTPRSAGG